MSRKNRDRMVGFSHYPRNNSRWTEYDFMGTGWTNSSYDEFKDAEIEKARPRPFPAELLASLLGMPRAEGEALAKERGYESRVIWSNGVQIIFYTYKLQRDRINLYVSDDKIFNAFVG